MSARPIVPRLDPEDLELLISRSLDGDLPPEEEQKLQQILAADPEAARRREELAGLVASLRTLPNHEPPFAIATRVNVQVADRVKGLGSTWHRFGLYPPPGLVGAAIAALVGVAISSVFFTTPRAAQVASRPALAKKPGSPVEVFFQEKERDAPAAAPAPKTMIAESQSRRQLPARRLDQVSGETRAEDREAGARFGAKADGDAAKNNAPEFQKDAGHAGALGGKVSISVASKPSEPAAAYADAAAAPSSVANEKDGNLKEEAQAADNKQLAKKQKAAEAPRDELAAGAPARVAAPAPADKLVTAPAAPPARLRAQLQASKPRWSISIVGPAQIGASWRLKKTPTTAPPDRPVTVLYHLTLDGAGRVVSARSQSGIVTAEVDEMVRGLLFEPAGEAGDNREVEVEITAK